MFFNAYWVLGLLTVCGFVVAISLVLSMREQLSLCERGVSRLVRSSEEAEVEFERRWSAMKGELDRVRGSLAASPHTPVEFPVHRTKAMERLRTGASAEQIARELKMPAAEARLLAKVYQTLCSRTDLI